MAEGQESDVFMPVQQDQEQKPSVERLYLMNIHTLCYPSPNCRPPEKLI